MGCALEIRNDLTAAKLGVCATREKRNRAARRMLAIANALDGMSRVAGMDRQACRISATNGHISSAPPHSPQLNPQSWGLLGR